MTISLPHTNNNNDWHHVLADQFSAPYFTKLSDFVDNERATQTVFPAESDVFNAFTQTPYEKVKVLLLGQDPYHGEGQAHGLSFSVRPGVALPPSLRNIYKELETDLGIPRSKSGDLTPWAQQGVLLLNAVLTVRKDTAASHAGKGWETFTDAVIRAVSAKEEPVVFLLWGGYAKKKVPLIDASKHVIIQGIHPSPLSANGGFFGSKPFSAVNAALEANGQLPIDWGV
jgi:uracil-DNA glycosylase